MNLIGRKLFDQTIQFLHRSLDVRAARHQLIAGNVANADTPDYQGKELPFKKILEQSLRGAESIKIMRTHPHHLPDPKDRFFSSDFDGEIEVDPSSTGIQIEKEMAKLAENHLMFQSSVQALIKKMEAIKFAISETR
jgi:flagellar basal-body rod protein FlgB